MLDVWYVDHQSLWLDVQILMRTMSVVFLGEEANPERLAQAIEYARQLGEVENACQLHDNI